VSDERMKQSWNKVEAGRYVLTTDTGYTATVHKGRDEDGVYWRAEVTLPSGVRVPRVSYPGDSDFETMAYAREWALDQIDSA
jgi:hypothetical protein